MKQSFEAKKFTWINMESPSTEEVAECIGQYKLEPLLAERILYPERTTDITIKKDLIITSLKFPTPHHFISHDECDIEIDFIIQKDLLITVHYVPMDILYEFQNKFERDLLQDTNQHSSPIILFFDMMDYIYKTIQDDLQFTDKNIRQIERSIFQGQSDKELAFRILAVRRELLDAHQAIRPHREIWRQLNSGDCKFAKTDFSNRVTNTSENYLRVFDTIDAFREILRELYKSHTTVVATRTNNIMKTISALALIGFPLTILAEIFGQSLLVNITSAEAIQYFIVSSVMATVIIALYFKIKGWMD